MRTPQALFIDGEWVRSTGGGTIPVYDPSTGREISAFVDATDADVDRAIEANPDVAEKIRAGKVAAAGALIGAVMKEMRGQADAARVRELVLERAAG